MSRSPFTPFLDAAGVVILDGGLATALEAEGHDLDTPLWSARALIDAPEAVRAVHLAYLEAGADCVTTAGYQGSFEGLEAAGLAHEEAREVLRRSVEIARDAVASFWSDGDHHHDRLPPIVAASAGPYGASLADGSEYDGRYGVGRARLVSFHEERLDVLSAAEPDVVALETVPSGLEAEALAELLATRPETPAWISFSCRDGQSLRDGTPIEDAVAVCGAVRSLVAMGVNCTAPKYIAGLIERIVTVTELPVVVYPNSGEGYDPATGSWTGRPDAWLDDVPTWVAAGARIVGGCCRVGPAEIRSLRQRLEGSQPSRDSA